MATLDPSPRRAVTAAGLATDEPTLGRDLPSTNDLLAEAQALAPPAAWARVEEAIRRIVELYSRGLVRAIGHARATGIDAQVYDDRIADDELLSSLLVLHGIHPRTVEERIARALASLTVPLGATAELAALDIDGVAYIRVGASPMEPASVADIVQRAVQQVAPELARIAVRVEAASG